MSLTPDIERALNLAIAAGNSVWGSTSPNPPVGCTILDKDGQVVGVGATQPPDGTGEHAEVMALRTAGEQARGGTAVVTLEPCNHTGRTGPCSHALLRAGIAKVYFATPDPNPAAAGGAEFLRSHGVDVHYLDVAIPALAGWLHGVATGRPLVTVKMAQTLDGFSAAQDGSSQWITGEQARQHAHVVRSRSDAIVVGTGTVVADNPRLTARDSQGNPFPTQPLIAVVGSRPIPSGHHLDRPEVLRYTDIQGALNDVWEHGCRSVLVEGGPTLVGSVLDAGLADRLHTYLNASLLGAGLSAVVWPHLPPTSMADIKRFEICHIEQLGNDIFIESRLPSHKDRM